MLIDTTPLLRIGKYTVLAERHEVLFRDDSIVGLHQVLHDGVPSVYLRCFVHDSLHALIFDVRHLAGSLAAEIPSCPARDLQGLVCFTMRLRFASATEFAGAVIGVTQAAALINQASQQLLLDGDPQERRYWPARLDARAFA